MIDHELVLAIGRLEGKIDGVREQLAERAQAYNELRIRQDAIEKKLSVIWGAVLFANVLASVGLTLFGILYKGV